MGEEHCGCYHREADFWGSQEVAGKRWPLSGAFEDDYLLTWKEWKGEHFRQKKTKKKNPSHVTEIGRNKAN